MTPPSGCQFYGSASRSAGRRHDSGELHEEGDRCRVAFFLTCSAALAFQNEAVRIMPDGSRKVELPPGPKRQAFQNIKRTADPWPTGSRLPSFVIEADRGLVECRVAWIDESCRDYVPGRDKRPRAWVMKRDRTWITCPKRASGDGCVPYYGLPVHELQE